MVVDWRFCENVHCVEPKRSDMYFCFNMYDVVKKSSNIRSKKGFRQDSFYDLNTMPYPRGKSKNL